MTSFWQEGQIRLKLDQHYVLKPILTSICELLSILDKFQNISRVFKIN